MLSTTTGQYYTNSKPFGSWSEVKVQIVSYSVQDYPFSSHPYAEYRIQVSARQSTWIVTKRYNQLVSLHKWISRNHMVDPVILPPFPDAPFFDTREYEDAAEERKFALEGYLEFLINVDEVFNSRPAQIFYEFGHMLSPSNRKQVLMPLPTSAFDLTQVAITWQVLTALGNCVVFATVDGTCPQHVPIQYEKGKGIPEAKRFYYELLKDESFSDPLTFRALDVSDFSAVVLTGCWIPEEKEARDSYINNKELHDKIREFWTLNLPVGAIAQGVLLLCRIKDENNNSLLYDRRTTSAQKYWEQAQYVFDLFSSEPKKDRGYSEDEIRGSLQDPAFYLPGPTSILQDTLYDSSSAFLCVDGNYLSARSTTDIYTFAKKFADMVYHSKQAQK